MADIGLEIDDIPNDSPVNINFSQNGYDSMLFIKNAGSVIIFIALLIFCWFHLIVVRIISKIFPTIIPFKNKLENLIVRDLTYNLLFSQFTPMMFSSLINLNDIRLKD